MIAVLRVGAGGTVLAANEAATSLFGTCVGRRCCDVVLARGDGHRLWCVPDCAGAVACGLASGRDRRGMVVRGRIARVACQRLGDETVVLVEAGRQIAAQSALTTREREVLGLIGEGMDSARIAEELGIGAATVRTHAERARTKLGARTRAEAVAIALRDGVIALRSE